MSDGRFGYVPNLHVILDGENRARAGTYLPFGIELVRKLIRQGRYANSKTVDVDDAVITAKVVGEQRWLRIWVGGRCELYLESGIVDVGSVGPANPAFNDNGKLYTNPALGAMPELNGLLSLPLGTENDPKPASGDVAEAFKKKVIKDEFGNETVDAASLSELQRKKTTINTVPPSLFTGKTRLYVQSIYGRRLKYFKKWSANTAFQPAALRYSGRYKGEDYTVDVSTNTGIFTTEDYNYFLLQVMGGSNQYVTVRKLVAESVCVDRARAYLVANKDELTEEKKTALEAYILSGSYPSDEIKFNLDAVIETNGSMGYGWHFNWDGTACDIIKVMQLGYNSVTYKYESKHLRMEFARDKNTVIPVNDPPLTLAQQERMRWAGIKQATLETKEFRNRKWQEVIAYPDWSQTQLAIFGVTWGADVDSDGAPFYCFYTKNDLKVCRHSKSGGTAGTMYRKESTPHYLAGYSTGWQASMPGVCGLQHLFGLEGGRYELQTRSTSASSTQLSCEGAVVSGNGQGWTADFVEYSAKTPDVAHDIYLAPFWIPSGSYLPTGDTVAAGYTASGCVDGYVFSPTGGYTLDPGAYGQSMWVCGFSMSATTGSSWYSEGALLLCVIPFDDAEACYLYGSAQINGGESGTTTTGVATSGSGSPAHIVRRITGGQYELVGYGTGYPVGDGFKPGSTTSPHETEYSSSTPLGKFLVCNEGVLEFNGEISPEFFAGDPVTHVPQHFTTRSAAAHGSVYGHGVSLTGGYTHTGHVFVGHA